MSDGKLGPEDQRAYREAVDAKQVRICGRPEADCKADRDAIRREAFEEAARVAESADGMLIPWRSKVIVAQTIRALASAPSAEQYAALEGDCAPLACSPASAKGNGDE